MSALGSSASDAAVKPATEPEPAAVADAAPEAMSDDSGPQDASMPSVALDAAMTIPQGGAMDADVSVGQGPVAPIMPDPPSPMPLRCGDTFCPLVSDPLKACCTSRGDVERRAARKAGACGVDLTALGEPAYGTGCWQRDQLGIIDTRCPSTDTEPGCCAEDGTCGTNNADRQLGCRHPAGSEVRACSDTEPETSCDPVGSYAMRVSVDTAWGGHGNGLFALTDDGRGPIQIYLLANIEGVDPETKSLKASGRLCGVTLPPFYSSILCESFQPVFPDSLWESKALPRPELEGTYECGKQGCVASLEPVTYLFGIRLNNPEASWPTPQQTQSLRCPNQPNEQCFADDDLDGLPGVLVKIQQGNKAMPTPSEGTGNTCRGGYEVRSAPLSDNVAAIFDGVRRTDRLLLGIRARVGGSVRFDNQCETGEGSAIAQYVNSRAKGCLVQPGSSDWVTRTPAGPNERCTTSEADFIDQSMPDYHVLASGEKPPSSRSGRDSSASKGPSVSVVRFENKGQPISCAEVRAAKF